MAEQGMRACEVSRDGAGYQWEEAIFHQWGSKIIYDEGNHPHDQTIAIVEIKASGEVLTPTPTQIRFR